MCTRWKRILDDKHPGAIEKSRQLVMCPAHLHLSTVGLVAGYNAVWHTHRAHRFHGEPAVNATRAEDVATRQRLGLPRGLKTDWAVGRQVVSTPFGRLVLCINTFCQKHILDDGDHFVVDVNEVDVSEAGASPTLTFKLEDGRQVTLCTDLLGHSEYSCQQGKGQTSSLESID